MYIHNYVVDFMYVARKNVSIVNGVTVDNHKGEHQ